MQSILKNKDKWYKPWLYQPCFAKDKVKAYHLQTVHIIIHHLQREKWQ